MSIVALVRKPFLTSELERREKFRPGHPDSRGTAGGLSAVPGSTVKAWFWSVGRDACGIRPEPVFPRSPQNPHYLANSSLRESF